MSDPQKEKTDSEPGPARQKRVVGLGILAAVLVGGLLAYSALGRRDRAVAREAYAPLASALVARGRPEDARRIETACGPGSDCQCVRTAARLGLDRDLSEPVLKLLAAQPAPCRATTLGLEAEALVRARRVDQARPLIERALQAEPSDSYATYARAQAAYVAGNLGAAETDARLAATRGRGAPAHLLLGLVALGRGDLGAARGEFEEILKTDPNDVGARYNFALVAQKQNRYRDAREGYLAVLRASPRELDARYNLALLVHSAGANAESRHHLEKLKAIAPAGDERVRQLEQLLAAAPPVGSALTLQVGSAQAQ
jgi:tetratricopeptide (TPR) repeat protein